MTDLFDALPAAPPAERGWPWSADAPVGGTLPEGCAWPKISLITPSYNQGAYLEKTLRSVLLQGYPNLEYIVIDGGSTDRSVEILKTYAPWLTAWMSEPDKGQSHAINKGLKRATGELLGWLNSDDILMPGALFRLAEAYLEDRSVGAVYGRGDIVDHYGKVVYSPRLEQVTEENLYAWFSGGAEFMQPSCLFTRQAWDICGPLAEDLHYAMDLDIWLKISKRFAFRMIDEMLSLSLKHEEAKTTQDKEQTRIDIALVYARHGNIEAARQKLAPLTEQLKTCQVELDYIHSLPIAWRIIRYFKRRRRQHDESM